MVQIRRNFVIYILILTKFVIHDFQSSPLPAGLKRSHFYYASDLAEQRLQQAEAARAAEEGFQAAGEAATRQRWGG